MKKILFFVSLSTFIYADLSAQYAQAVNDAFILTKMVEKFHFQPKPLNDAFSADVYKQLLKQLDEDRIFFTQEDINILSQYRYKLDEEISGRKQEFLQTLLSIYQKRLLQADTMIAEIMAQPFNYSIAEKFSVAEDTSWPAIGTMQRTKLYKVFKASALQAVITDKDFSLLNSSSQTKYVDSIEPFIRKQIKKIFSRRVKMMLQSPGGVQQTVAEEYCKAIASCYDPHTAFLPLTEKENFESQLGQKSMAFGFSLDEDEDGEIIIEDLKPGSPAFKSGQINKGDKIESVQWEGKEPVDLSGSGMEELSQTLGMSNHDKAVLKVTKADGTTREVALWKESVEDDADNNKVKSFLLQGSKTIGYLSLPAFYEDWENGNGVNGCANDVAKEIVKLKSENIVGLILDLRYNGGGSMQEAIELAGIFIDAGPVGQYKTRDEKAYTLKDANRGTIYDGPLMVLVNGYSASASEIIAGTLQDYHRAVVVGSPTYGKATAQVVLPMDTTISLESDVSKVKADSYLKVTVSQLYRITGKTAQANGVLPDVNVPDVLEAQNNKESDNAFAILAKDIEANKYYKPLQMLPVTELNVVAKSKINESKFFKLVNTYIEKEKFLRLKKDMSLQLQDALLGKGNINSGIPSPLDSKTPNTSFTIQTHTYENQRLQTNKNLAAIDHQWKDFLSADPHVRLAYDLMLIMAK